MSTYRPDAGNPDSGLKKWFVEETLVSDKVHGAPVKFVKGTVPDGYAGVAAVNESAMPDFISGQAAAFLARAKARPAVVDAPSTEKVFATPVSATSTEAFSLW